MKKILLFALVLGTSQSAIAIESGSFVTSPGSNPAFRAFVDEEESTGAQRLSVIQISPILKQRPADYELRSKGRARNAFDHGDLVLIKAGTNGDFESYYEPMSMQPLLVLRRANGEVLQFKRER